MVLIRRLMRGFCLLFAGSFPAIGALGCASDSGSSLSAELADDTSTVLIADVTLIPMDSAYSIAGQAVIVKDDRIAWVGPAEKAAVSRAATRVDASGLYLLPGLIDMHVHTDEADFPLYLAAGVTTVLFKHGDAEHLEWRRRSRAGELLAPRIFTTGPLVAGRPIHWPHVVATTTEEARAIVEEQAASGYDFIKVYDFLPAAAYEALAKTADSLGMAFLGHIPDGVGLPQAIAAGQFCFDHAEQIVYALYGREGSMEVPKSRAGEAAEIMAGSSACLNSALAGMKFMMGRGSGWFDSLYTRPEMAYVEDGLKDWWSSFRSGPPSPEAWSRRQHFYDFQVRLTRALHEAGVSIVAGTDSPNLLLVPGFSLHDELDVLTEDVGLTPYEALRTVTVNAATALGQADSFGTIEAGKIADLVLASANPLLAVEGLRRPEGVLVRGRWLPRDSLDALLIEVQELR